MWEDKERKNERDVVDCRFQFFAVLHTHFSGIWRAFLCSGAYNINRTVRNLPTRRSATLVLTKHSNILFYLLKKKKLADGYYYQPKSKLNDFKD